MDKVTNVMAGRYDIRGTQGTQTSYLCHLCPTAKPLLTFDLCAAVKATSYFLANEEEHPPLTTL